MVSARLISLAGQLEERHSHEQISDPFLRALAQAAEREAEELTQEASADVDTALADIAAGRIIADVEA